MVEKELREARTLLVDASTTAADTESTLSNLNETIHILQDENKSLHDKMEQVQDRARVEQERLQEALDMAQKTAQELRLQATAHDQEIQRVFSEKAGCEKQIVQLKTRITNLEKRLKDTASFMSPPTAPKGNAAISSETESQRSRTNSSAAKSFRIPPLTPGNASDIAASTTKICCLCNRVASGLMKSCQCGQANCDKRAHSTCISARGSGSSLSHPGTPAPRLPLVLCSLTPAGKE
jgi:predicted  nucleic acid-binding Zn-ribbon protein